MFIPLPPCHWCGSHVAPRHDRAVEALRQKLRDDKAKEQQSFQGRGWEPGRFYAFTRAWVRGDEDESKEARHSSFSFVNGTNFDFMLMPAVLVF